MNLGGSHGLGHCRSDGATKKKASVWVLGHVVSGVVGVGSGRTRVARVHWSAGESCGAGRRAGTRISLECRSITRVGGDRDSYKMRMLAKGKRT